MNPAEIYAGSNGELTKQLYATLETLGPRGVIALNLFRAQKASARAKVYRGGIRGQGSFKRMAYDKKSWSIDLLCGVLQLHALPGDGLTWGWKQDPDVLFGERPSWVLYVDLPEGQVSFHSPTRGAGPDYLGDWDGSGLSEQRIIAFVSRVLLGEPAPKSAILPAIRETQSDLFGE